ncbi:MAG: LytR/AlgR family response regulator transcription factor [Ekhidna sp.]
MSALNIIIVEDEMITAESIKDMLEDLGYNVMGIYIRATKALEAIKELKPDFALLDINLKGEETGIWLAEQLHEEHNIPYVFLTSYGDKATIEKATNTNPYGYLLKPIEKQHLFASIEVAIKKFGEINTKEESSDFEVTVLKDSLFVKDEYLYVKVNFKDIHYVKSSGNYLEINTAKDKKHIIKGTLGSFIQTLPENMFFQTHRSYLINIEKIEAFGGNYVKIGSEDIPITPLKKDELFEYINLYKKG